MMVIKDLNSKPVPNFQSFHNKQKVQALYLALSQIKSGKKPAMKECQRTPFAKGQGNNSRSVDVGG